MCLYRHFGTQNLIKKIAKSHTFPDLKRLNLRYMRTNTDAYNLLKWSISKCDDLFINSQVSPEHRLQKLNIKDILDAIEKAAISLDDTLSLGYFIITNDDLYKVFSSGKNLK